MLGKRNHFTRKRLEAHGVVATATVLEIADRGMTVSHNGGNLVADTEVILKTTLRIEPAGQPAFEVRQRFRYPQLSIPTAGTRLTVRFDPDDHDKVMIDPSALPTTVGGMDLSGLRSLASSLQDAKRTGGPDAVADAVRSAFGGQATVIDARAFAGQAGESPEEERIRNLERLAALHATGALTDAEFAAQKAAVLAPAS